MQHISPESGLGCTRESRFVLRLQIQPGGDFESLPTETRYTLRRSSIPKARRPAEAGRLVFKPRRATQSFPQHSSACWPSTASITVAALALRFCSTPFRALHVRTRPSSPFWWTPRMMPLPRSIGIMGFGRSLRAHSLFSCRSGQRLSYLKAEKDQTCPSCRELRPPA